MSYRSAAVGARPEALRDRLGDAGPVSIASLVKSELTLLLLGLQ